MNIFNSRNGDVLQVLGLDGSTNPNGNASSVDAIKAVKLEEFDALLDAKNKELQIARSTFQRIC
ncbi:hypothetical protein MGH68_08025 [Erysipelothrix sp. D19-032]